MSCGRMSRCCHRTVELVLALLVSMICTAATPAGEIVPTNGMIITEDVTFVPGTYLFSEGVFVGAPDITIDFNGAEFVGTDFQRQGIFNSGFDNVTIRNGRIRNYYYGVRVEFADGARVLDMNLSDNWVDPDSLGQNAPFLNINVGPGAYGDRTNLGGGLFMKNADGATIARNTMRHGENGMDLYAVTNSTIIDNDCSDNTGWGIHLYASTGNVIENNTADRCTRAGLGDSAGVLLVFGSHDNDLLDNRFRHSGDGFFIGNEHGCPSNDNHLQGNDGSFAGANAFEATFSSGNQFIDNIADGSNYGFWLGYSHTGNVIRGNSIRANNVNGIEIEHGQLNTIEANEIIGNGGKAIVLRTDGLVHFPANQYPCLNLPNQEDSSFYTIRDNIIHSNFGKGLELVNTTDSTIVNNLLAENGGGTATSNGANNVWSIDPVPGENIVGGPNLGGNYWDNYTGIDTNGDGLGDTNLPYTNNGQIALPGDEHPLIGDPDIQGFNNPRTMLDWVWTDLGRNTRSSGGTFNTSNGTHFATDGIELYLLESANSNRLDRYNPQTNRYEPRAGLPESVWDGGDLQHGGGLYFATVGVQFDRNNGSGKGSKLYAYDPIGNSWQTRAASTVGGDLVANEGLAWDPVNARLYAVIVETLNGGDPSLRRRLAIYDPVGDAWLGTTSEAGDDFGAGSEAEYLDGKVYVWPGLLRGGAVNGSDSFLHVYDIATDTWDVTPSLQDSAVIPGFRSGAFDIWGVTISSDPVRRRLFVQGGEVNRQVYVFDVASQTWAVTPVAVYDGGWGDSLEFVAASESLYQIDGRNAQAAPQGTAVLRPNLQLPTAFNVVFGQHVSGDVQSLVESDDVRLVVEQRPSVSVLLPSIRVEIEGVADAETTEFLRALFESSCTAVPPTVPLRIELRDFETGLWERVSDTIATSSDSVIELPFAESPSRLIEPGSRRLQARMNWFDPGNVVFVAWRARIDRAVWSIAPEG